MMKRNGFIFVETIIVIVILSVALLVVYRAFNTTIIHEKQRLNYDDPVYLYRTYYIRDFLYPEFEDTMAYLTTEDKVIAPFVCTNISESNIKAFCEVLIQSNKLGVANVYIAKGMINDLFKDEYLENQSILSTNMISYLKTLSNVGEYMIVIEFKENCGQVEGSSVDACDYNYASLRMVVEEE